MYLVDTSIFLEIFLRRQRSKEAKRLLSTTPFNELYITDLSLHTIGNILFKHNLYTSYIQLINDLFIKNEVWRIQLGTDMIDKVVKVAEKYSLDYIDAYQYAAAELYDLTLVSFNDVFDRTEKGRKEPVALLRSL
jgi:predicted nucleic acid-binding protein